jgi:hypothetical protein
MSYIIENNPKIIKVPEIYTATYVDTELQSPKPIKPRVIRSNDINPKLLPKNYTLVQADNFEELESEIEYETEKNVLHELENELETEILNEAREYSEINDPELESDILVKSSLLSDLRKTDKSLSRRLHSRIVEPQSPNSSSVRALSPSKSPLKSVRPLSPAKSPSKSVRVSSVNRPLSKSRIQSEYDVQTLERNNIDLSEIKSELKSEILNELQSNNIPDIEVQSRAPLESVVSVKSTYRTINQPKLAESINNLFVQVGYGLRFFTVESDMLKEQDNRYTVELKAYESIDASNLIGELRNLTPYTNFMYPKSIWSENFAPDNIDIDGGWITRNTVAELGLLSPKLDFLVKWLGTRRNRRHVIYTRHGSRYGLDLIVGLLKYSKFNPLVITNDFRDSAGRLHKNSQYRESIKVWNSDSRFNVIVCNRPNIEVPLLDVDYIHFVEDFSFETFIKISNKIYHSPYYRIKKPLTIVAHICNRANNTKSTDFYSFEKFSQSVAEKIAEGAKYN